MTEEPYARPTVFRATLDDRRVGRAGSEAVRQLEILGSGVFSTLNRTPVHLPSSSRLAT
jgi:hypothetical protein